MENPELKYAIHSAGIELGLRAKTHRMFVGSNELNLPAVYLNEVDRPNTEAKEVLPFVIERMVSEGLVRLVGREYYPAG
jgi:hypothetical protein